LKYLFIWLIIALILDGVRRIDKHLRIRRLEAQQILGYQQRPVQANELDDWEAIRDWGDA
jgi:hypothetical protein